MRAGHVRVKMSTSDGDPAGSHRALALTLLALRKAADVYHGVLSATVFGFSRRDLRTAYKSLRFMFDPPCPSKKERLAFYLRMKQRDRLFYKRINPVQRYRRHGPTQHITRLLFRAVADPDRIVWVRAAALTDKTIYDHNLYFNDILPGDWDRGSQLMVRTHKHRSVVQHFRQGLAWEDTELFTSKYIPALESGRTVRGARTLGELTRYYETHMDGLYDSIRALGFLVTLDENDRAVLPHVHVGRHGQILIGNNGNHRVSIAQVLGVERVPCNVRARHLEWQLLRDAVATLGPGRCWDVVGRKFATHPDLADLIPPGSDT